MIFMIMKRGMNKKAQEGGASGSTIVGWVLLAILLVIIVLAISGFFNPILEKLSLIPGGGIAGLVTACDGYAQLGSKTDYCTFRDVKVSGVKQYVNCLDARIHRDISAESQDKYPCETSYKDETCIGLIKKGVKTMPIVNGEPCSEKQCTTSTGLSGELSAEDNKDTVVNEAKCPPAGNAGLTRPITFGVSDESVKGILGADGKREAGTKVCCVAP